MFSSTMLVYADLCVYMYVVRLKKAYLKPTRFQCDMKQVTVLMQYQPQSNKTNPYCSRSLKEPILKTAMNVISSWHFATTEHLPEVSDPIEIMARYCISNWILRRIGDCVYPSINQSMTESPQQLDLTNLVDAFGEGVKYFYEYELGFMSFVNS